MYLLCLFVFACTAQLEYSTMHWVALSEFPDALCNDGSVAGYYLSHGTNKAKWVIYLEGGGFCFSEESCSTRNVNLTSSLLYPAKMYASGILSNNATVNKHWNDATMVYVKYCSSDSFSGMNPDSDLLGWKFMGSAIVEATILSLEKIGLGKATQVLFTGTSAGAEGLYPNADRVAAMLPRSNLRVLLDSGWFMDFAPYRPLSCRDLGQCTEQDALKYGVPHWKPRVDSDCASSKSKEDLWQCMLGYHAFPYLSTPAFVFQYRFDAAQMGHDGLGEPKKEKELAYVRAGIHNLTVTFNEAKPTGVFSASCYRHGILGLPKWTALTVQGSNLDDAFESWRKNPSKLHIYQDTCVDPNCNPTCLTMGKKKKFIGI